MYTDELCTSNKFLVVNRGCCIVIEVLLITKFKLKSRSIISEFFVKMSTIYKTWHNFRKMCERALQIAYYATFASTIYQSLIPRLSALRPELCM